MRLIAALLALLIGASVGSPQGYAQKDPKQEKQMLAQLGKSYTAAKKAYAKAPKNAAAKKSFVAASVKLGTACMYSQTMDRKVKYRDALRYYREALKLDPKNSEAKGNYDLIVSIYKQMGRPIPKD